MKKVILISVLALFASTASFAQEDSHGWSTKYYNIGFINAVMSQDEMPDLKTNFGASFTTGKTYYITNPLAGFLRVGVDVTWFDLDYTNYKIKHITDAGTEQYQYHQGDVSVQVGPSLTVRAFNALYLHGYFRYAPTYSILKAKDTLYGNYAGYYVGGGSISIKRIGLGFETRFGKTEYNVINLSKENESDDSTISHAAAYTGWKAYLTYRF